MLANAWFNQIRLACIFYFEKALTTNIQRCNWIFQFSQIINTASTGKFDGVKFNFTSLTQFLSTQANDTFYSNYVGDWVSFRWWEKNMKHANKICKCGSIIRCVDMTDLMKIMIFSTKLNWPFVFLLTIDICLSPGLPIMNQIRIHIYQFLI